MSTALASRSEPAFVTGLFADSQQAAEGFRRLVEAGFDPHEISVVRIDGPLLENIPVNHRSGVPTGVATGMTLGGSLGLAGALALGSTVLGFLAHGPIVAMLQAVLLGVTSGGLLGALAGLAFWWDEPDLEAELRRGAVLIGVAAQGARGRAARAALRAEGATRIHG